MQSNLKPGAKINYLYLAALAREPSKSEFTRANQLLVYRKGDTTAALEEGTWLSYKLNDISQGQDAMPLWIPQLSMAIGTTVLAIGLVDHLIQILFTGESKFIESSLSDSATE